MLYIVYQAEKTFDDISDTVIANSWQKTEIFESELAKIEIESESNEVVLSSETNM